MRFKYVIKKTVVVKWPVRSFRRYFIYIFSKYKLVKCVGRIHSLIFTTTTVVDTY